MPQDQIESLVNRNLIADYYLELPDQILKQAKEFAKELSQTDSNPFPGGFSPSLDFHWSIEQQTLKLIEANTNAAFLGLSLPLYQAARVPFTSCPSEIASQFLAITQTHEISRTLHLAIVDETPQSQSLYIEFLYYKKLFSRYFDKVTIEDSSKVTGQESCIYNRVTDFYFEKPHHKLLLDFWKKHNDRISPNPNDYRFFADKTNVTKWSENPKLAPYIPKLQIITEHNKEEIWSNRKRLFFKPNQSFGSKMTYRGSSISRGHFEQLLSLKSALAQEFIPAPEILTERHGPLKFDLRFYVYQGEVTQSVARLYQGQVTNSKTPGGGFAPIQWI
jgi:hypothetical protein